MVENENGRGDVGESSPLVSIALCTYNGGRYLAEQLDSLLAQTYSNMEIVVSDDGSSDETVSILNGYAGKDSRIRVVAHTSNVGLTRNFERNLRECRGDYIAPCDQDDIWAPEKIDVLVSALGGNAAVFCDSSFMDQSGAALGKRMSDVVNMISTKDPLPFAFANCVSGHAMLFRRQVLQYAFPVPEEFFYDWWLATVSASLGGIAFCDRSLVRYRQHATNVTDTLGRRAQPEQESPRGHRIRFLNETQKRLEAIARLPGPEREFAGRLLALWRERQTQWLSPRLGRLMMRHRARFYSISRLSARTIERQSKQFYWGLKAKRLSNSHGYTLP